MSSIRIAENHREILRCFPVIHQLRLHLTQEAFVEQVQRQISKYSYQLCYLEEDGQVQCVAGFRISECLALGKYLYVDDLVTDESQRSKGYGEQVLAWLVRLARENNCQVIHLDSGVQRFSAHRFYMKQGMYIASHHFSMALDYDKTG